MVEKELEKPIKDLEDVKLVKGDASKLTKVGGGLDPPLKEEIVEFLKKNLDIFAWAHEDMPGIDNRVIEHRLKVDPTKSPSKKNEVFLLSKGIRPSWKKLRSS